jgi:hypothetical protein
VHLLGGHAGAWAEDLAMAGAGDALLAIVMAPRLRVALLVLEYARTTRLRTVAAALATHLGATATRRAELIRAIHEEIEDLEV